MFRYAAIGLISAGTILLELALLRIFAVQQFYHFAFMAISLALLGAGASGSILALRKRPFSPSSTCLLFGVTTLGAYLVINHLPFDSFSIAWDRRQLLYLAIYFLVAGIPFLFAGLVVGGALMAPGGGQRWGDSGGENSAGSHQIYGANLLGSAFGALLALPILALVGGQGAVFVAAGLGAAAGFLFSLEARKRLSESRGSSTLLLSAALVAFCLLILIIRPSFIEQTLSPYKTLSVLSNALDAQRLFSGHDATARIDLIKSSTIHVMPGLSLSSPVGPPPQAGLTIDGDNLMPINQLAPESSQALDLGQNLPIGLAYQLRPEAHTLILEAGTGSDLLFALALGAPAVTAVEESGQIIDVAVGQYGPDSGQLFKRPAVELINQSARVFAGQYSLNRELGEGEYDLTILSLADTHRPVTSGAYSLTEDYGRTVEAFQSYLGTLKPDGLLLVSRWLQTPPSESLRTFASMADALRGQGRDPRYHLLAFRTLRTMTFVSSLKPFSDEEIGQTVQFLQDRGFDIVYYPGVQRERLNQYNLLSEPVYHDLFQRILADGQQTYAAYRFDIRPSTDDRPFFYHYFKWQQTPEIFARLGLTWQPFGGSGYFVLVALLIVVSMAALIFILGPLLLGRKGRGLREPVRVPFWRPRVFVYFACLGLAFLFVEVPLAQRFILLLDQPVTALAVILFSILFFSGLGSLTVRRWRLPLAMVALVILAALYPFLLDALSPILLSLPTTFRVATIIIFTAPLGYLMGLPFAGGLRVVEREQGALVPWSWAINGSFSVISSVLAIMIALSLGLSAVIWLGAAAYAAALLVFYRLM